MGSIPITSREWIEKIIRELLFVEAERAAELFATRADKTAACPGLTTLLADTDLPEIKISGSTAAFDTLEEAIDVLERALGRPLPPATQQTTGLKVALKQALDVTRRYLHRRVLVVTRFHTLPYGYVQHTLKIADSADHRAQLPRPLNSLLVDHERERA